MNKKIKCHKNVGTKLIAALIMAAFMLPIFQLTAMADAPGITVEVNGFAVDFGGQPPVIVDGRTLVPVRGVFEELGFTVEWEVYAPQTATLSNDSHTVHVTVGSGEFTTNDVTHQLDVSAQIIGGRTMLPIRAVLESVGLHLYWFDWRQTVAIRNEPLPVPFQSVESHIFPEHLHGAPADLEALHQRQAWINAFLANFFYHELVFNDYGISNVSWSASGDQLDSFNILLNDGTLWGWGNNNNGRLGLGTTGRITTPGLILDYVFSQVGGAGVNNGLALRYDGTVWSFGLNSSGQLGDGTTETRTRPLMVMENVVSATTSSSNNVALREDGTLWVWGINTTGQLGDGTTTSRHSPFMLLDNVVSFEFSPGGGTALRTDGSLWAWGSHWFGGGIMFESLTPVVIAENFVLPEEGVYTFIADDGTEWFRPHFMRQIRPTNPSGERLLPPGQ